MYHGFGNYVFAMYAFFFFSQQNGSCLKISKNHLIYTELSYQEKIKTIFAAMHTLKMWFKLF